MIERRLVDTNLIVRYLVQDHEKHARTAARLFEACDRGDLIIVVLAAVLAECVFVLESFYEHARNDIARTLSDFIASPGVDIAHLPIYVDALERYRTTKGHFIDCVVAAHAVADDMAVATFDQDFRRFTDVLVTTDVA